MFLNQTTNVNPESGIRYGVISANNVPWLEEKIFNNGESISYREAVKELRSRIERFIDEPESLREILLHDYYLTTYSVDDVLQLIAEYDQDEYTEETIDGVMDLILEEINLEFDEEIREYHTDEEHYIMDWLGGAQMIWALKSPVLTKVNLCSPCVPNAGNLEDPNEEGYECYAVEPDYFDKNRYPCPYQVYSLVV
jgi:hypothetical protein